MLTSSGNGGLDEGVQLLVSSDGQMQVTRGDSLHLEILGSVSGQLQHFGGQVFEDRGAKRERLIHIKLDS